MTIIDPQPPTSMLGIDAGAATTALSLTIVLHPGGWWPALVAASALSFLLLFWTSFQDSRVAWTTMFVLLAFAFLRNWWITDNHHLVVVAAVLLWATTVHDAEGRAEGARLIIGAVFALAVLAKFATGEYLGGEFGRVWPVYEPRLAGLTIRMGVISEEELAANVALVRDLSIDAQAGQTIAGFQTAPAWFARAFTIWTLVIESVISVCYLMGGRRGFLAVGHIALLLFCLTTYTIVPVLGFAAVLLALAIATENRKLWLTVLIVAFAAVELLPITAHLI